MNLKYFYEVHVQANQNNEITFFIRSDSKRELTVDEIKQNPAFAEFAKQKFNRIMIDYMVYSYNAELPESDEQLMSPLACR